MCERAPRDGQGRLLPGARLNPAGKPARKPLLRLLEAAEACGAGVVVLLPPRIGNDDTNPVPPVAA